MGRAARRRREAKQQNGTALTADQQNDFLRVVREDLDFLRGLDLKRPTRTHARVASSILRRLLHEGLLQQAWSAAGLSGSPTFTAVDLNTMLGGVPSRYINYAYAGGANTEGAQHSGQILFLIPAEEAARESPEEILKRINPPRLSSTKRSFSLTEFCESASVVSGDATISRVELIRYVANKLGGVHWDPSRIDWENPIGSRHRLLDEEHVRVGLLSAPLYEVISITQAVAIADDVTKLIARIAEIVPQLGNSGNTLSLREGRIGKFTDWTFEPKPTAE